MEIRVDKFLAITAMLASAVAPGCGSSSDSSGQQQSGKAAQGPGAKSGGGKTDCFGSECVADVACIAWDGAEGASFEGTASEECIAWEDDPGLECIGWDDAGSECVGWDDAGIECVSWEQSYTCNAWSECQKWSDPGFECVEWDAGTECIAWEETPGGYCQSFPDPAQGLCVGWKADQCTIWGPPYDPSSAASEGGNASFEGDGTDPAYEQG